MNADNQTTEEFLGVMTGRVRHFKIDYGFITPDDSTLSDVFVHCRQIEPWREGFKVLEVGDVVKFELWRVKSGPKGLQARNVDVKRQAPKMSDFSTDVPDDFGNRKPFERDYGKGE